ncbi:winged helix-turn-helix domain-containing protein [soil metagenome]
MESLVGDIYRFGDFELDCGRRQLTLGNEKVMLSAKTFDLLQHLVENRGKLISKDELLDAVWPGQIVEENNLTVQISALRKALGSGDIITNVPGKGYCFVEPVELAGAGEEEIVIEQRTVERIVIDEPVYMNPTSPVPQLTGQTPNWRKTAFLAGLIFVVIGGIWAVRYFRNAPAAKINSIAVLPFVNQTADENNEYLSDGIAESVTYSLSQVPDLKVMSRNSVFRYKGSESDAKRIGSELNVSAILTGRVSQRGDSLNISTELISALDNSVIWGEQFTRKLSDIEKLQSDIAGSISNKLRLKLTGVTRRGTENAEAYRTYLQALFYWNKRTPENIEKSIELFKKAISLDPQFGQAYGGLTVAYEVQVANGAYTQDEVKRIDLRTKEAIRKALEMDDSLVEAHAANGMRRFQDWEFAESEAAFRRAISINPNYATAHQWYSEMLAAVGRTEEALAEIERALELDPYSRAVNMNLGLRYLAARRTDDAIGQFKKLIESEPDYPMSYIFLGNAYIEKGMLLESLDPGCKASDLLKIDPPDLCEKENEAIRAAYRRDGPAGFWQESLKVTQRLAKKGVADDTSVAAAYMRVGDRDKGFELLEKAFNEHSPYLPYIRDDAPFRDLTDDPRFQSLLVRIGLPPK